MDYRATTANPCRPLALCHFTLHVGQMAVNGLRSPKLPLRSKAVAYLWFHLLLLHHRVVSSCPWHWLNKHNKHRTISNPKVSVWHDQRCHQLTIDREGKYLKVLYDSHIIYFSSQVTGSQGHFLNLLPYFFLSHSNQQNLWRQQHELGFTGVLDQQEVRS